MDNPKSEVYNINCMEYMKTLPDKSFDLAIVDPPYGIGISRRRGSIGQKKGQGKLTRYTSKSWDDNIPDKLYFSELFRVSKNQIIFGGNYFTEYLPPSKGWIVWDKKQPEGVSFAMAELAFTSFNISVKMYSCSRAYIGNKISNNDVLAQSWVKIHPTQKPIPLYSWLLNIYAQKGDRILDTHLGSGSSRIAAYKLGFDFVGCEIDKEYFDKSVERFNRECLGEYKESNGDILKQLELFNQ